MASPRVVVTLLKRVPPFQPGERAGLSKEAAARYVAKGLAIYYDPKADAADAARKAEVAARKAKQEMLAADAKAAAKAKKDAAKASSK